ncbi:nickel insertion protein [Cloacibacillus sp. An23]|uniref:nickel insertion protein n=1 Tax=Cloacibacillus sp. An23 TaxID=1965591 RepID=UPI000B37BA21|nr:nickel insertion protein [Cloacibacillus sp. An23]OUO93023.1 hypothetical protein B5F39_09235 [Cloacibacillus sp. An23]
MAEGESGGLIRGRAIEISANIDDMTGEDLGAAMELLLAAGALDVWFEHIQMKKNRPAVKLCVLAAPEETERFAELMLRHTTTLGVRMREVERLMLAREIRKVGTRYGEVRFKRGMLGGETLKETPEYEDIRRIAHDTGLPMARVRAEAAVDAEIQAL